MVIRPSPINHTTHLACCQSQAVSPRITHRIKIGQKPTQVCNKLVNNKATSAKPHPSICAGRMKTRLRTIESTSTIRYAATLQISCPAFPPFSFTSSTTSATTSSASSLRYGASEGSSSHSSAICMASGVSQVSSSSTSSPHPQPPLRRSTAIHRTKNKPEKNSLMTTSRRFYPAEKESKKIFLRLNRDFWLYDL